jgi:cytidine deaminase
MDDNKLIKAAVAALKNSHSPFSHFPVGAALLTKSGKIFTGCNIESSSYGLTICAERVALFKAISEGHKDFEAIAIASQSNQSCPPCGACRQVLWDFAQDIDVLLVENHKDFQKFKIAELLPKAFGEGFFLNDH